MSILEQIKNDIYDKASERICHPHDYQADCSTYTSFLTEVLALWAVQHPEVQEVLFGG